MKAQETTFQVLVGGEKQFQIPIYQRTYSWELAQLQTLWNDITEHADALRDGDSQASHFVGSVVLAPSPASMPGLGRWLVVDGQQRLTTLMLAMCAIRDHLAPASPRDRDRINELYLVNKFREGSRDYYRLLPTKADRDAFFSCISGAPEAGGPGRIGQAYRFFRRAVEAADDPADPHDIDRIETVIRERLVMVEIAAHRDDNVHRIFESLNNTGMGLTQADLVRNLVFMLLPTRGENVYEQRWLPMQDRLGTALEDLLYLHLVLRGQVRVLRDELYRAMQSELTPIAGDEKAIEGVVGELGRQSELFKKIIDPAREDDPHLRAALARLKTWRAQATYPVLLHLLDLRSRSLATTKQVTEAVAYVESFLVRRMICGIPPNSLIRIFNSAVGELPADKNVAEGLRLVLSAERRFWPTDGDLEDAILSKPFYWQGRPEQRQLVLRRLEESYESKEPIDFAQAKPTIEHIMPQTAGPEWLAALAEGARDDEAPEDVHRRLLHTLGNLTLSAYNTELSNHFFDRKQELLKDSALRMNHRIAGATKWGEAEIKARGRELAAHAVQLWPGPLPGVSTPRPGHDWSLLHQALAALPPASWTTYGDLAALIGSHPVPIGAHVASARVANAHRVLSSTGRLVRNFHWDDPDDDRDPVDVLRAEGVILDQSGVADPNQRMDSRDLAQLLGIDPGDEVEVSGWDGSGATELEQRLTEQIDRHGPRISGAVHRLMDTWRSMGGGFRFGRAADTSCAFVYGDHDRIWPLLVYPMWGAIEVSLQALATRPPFDDVSLRLAFIQELNKAPGVSISPAKVNLRPSIRLQALEDPAAFAAIQRALQWFVAQVPAVAGARSEEATA